MKSGTAANGRPRSYRILKNPPQINAAGFLTIKTSCMHTYCLPGLPLQSFHSDSHLQSYVPLAFPLLLIHDKYDRLALFLLTESHNRLEILLLYPPAYLLLSGLHLQVPEPYGYALLLYLRLLPLPFPAPSPLSPRRPCRRFPGLASWQSRGLLYFSLALSGIACLNSSKSGANHDDILAFQFHFFFQNVSCLEDILRVKPFDRKLSHITSRRDDNRIGI